ncbi:MAG: hypothetical protein KAS32_21340 [Candidatus Peribacteraceae bacterium]|nr:hypothetical protein [Candidatus Peribacteraceae bacterium]
MKTVEDICKYIGSVICDGPVCIETGCTYVMEPGNEIHTTTNNLMKHVCLYRHGILFSLDVSQEHLDFALSILPDGDATYQVHINPMLGDSVGSLMVLGQEWSGGGEGNSIDVLCLDSKEFDEDHMVNEYNAIKHALAERHFVLVDDIHNPNSVKYKKMVPILKDLGYEYIEVKTPTGMFVATKGYVLP